MTIWKTYEKQGILDDMIAALNFEFIDSYSLLYPDTKCMENGKIIKLSDKILSIISKRPA